MKYSYQLTYFIISYLYFKIALTYTFSLKHETGNLTDGKVHKSIHTLVPIYYTQPTQRFVCRIADDFYQSSQPKTNSNSKIESNNLTGVCRSVVVCLVGSSTAPAQIFIIKKHNNTMPRMKLNWKRLYNIAFEWNSVIF